MEIMQNHTASSLDFKTLNYLQESILICNNSGIVFKNLYWANKFGKRDVFNEKTFSVHSNQINYCKTKMLSLKELISC
jgi:hypothetical protein